MDYLQHLMKLEMELQAAIDSLDNGELIVLVDAMNSSTVETSNATSNANANTNTNSQEAVESSTSSSTVLPFVPSNVIKFVCKDDLALMKEFEDLLK